MTHLLSHAPYAAGRRPSSRSMGCWVGLLALACAASLSCAPAHTTGGKALGQALSEGEPRCALVKQPRTEGREIVYLSSMRFYTSAGQRPMSGDQWREYNPTFPWRRLPESHLLYEQSCLYRSPEAQESCEGEACFRLTGKADHTWLYTAHGRCTLCYPQDGACSPASLLPPDGHVWAAEMEECLELVFQGEIIKLTDPWGNKFAMHASTVPESELDAHLERLVLPEGWSVTRRTLQAPLRLKPRMVGGRCVHHRIRDAQGNSYHQYGFDGMRNVHKVLGGCLEN